MRYGLSRTYGTEFRARKKQEQPERFHGECTTRRITPQEEAWLDTLPKPERKKTFQFYS